MSKTEWLYTAMILAVIGVAIWYPGYKCEQKALKMQAYDWDYSRFTTGCMVKETSKSSWRDVVSQ